MRKADADGLDSLIAIKPNQQGLGRAILDRLMKASAPRI
jgi:hypothetical protein